MEEEFIIFVSEKDLEEFPESDVRKDNAEREDNNHTAIAIEDKKETEPRKKNTSKQEKQQKIPSLLDLKFPEVYATWRNGRWSRNQRTMQKKVNWARARSRWSE